MALHHQLPIYKLAYDLLSVTTDITRNIPRDFKRLIGEKVREECVEILVLIFRANVARNKTPHIEDLLERLQVVELLLRLSKDKRFISTKQYARAIEITDGIGRQATGWKRHAAAAPAV
ncbi:MAG: four helix bundle protein [Pseudomonadales bacterium]|nr:four helix bundle protein [Pseudomonadales bacterium]